MKKFTGFIAAAAIAIAPMSASALTALSDNAMNDVTGQSGVSIAIDDVVLETWVGATTYTDLDGTNGDAGSITIEDKHTVKSFNAITQYDGAVGIESIGTGLTKKTIDAAALAKMNNATGFIKALTIDVGNCSVLADGGTTNMTLLGTPTNITVAGVVIGLPTLEIVTSSDEYKITAGLSGAVNDGHDYIQVTTGEKVQHILGGVLEIAPH